MRPQGPTFAYCAYLEYFEYALSSMHTAATAQRPITLPKAEQKRVEELEAVHSRGKAALVSSAAVAAGLYDRNKFPEGGQDE